MSTATLSVFKGEKKNKKKSMRKYSKCNTTLLGGGGKVTRQAVRRGRRRRITMIALHDANDFPPLLTVFNYPYLFQEEIRS